MRFDNAAALPEGVIEEFMEAWRDQATGSAIPTSPAIPPSAIARLTPHLMVLEATVDGGPGRFRSKLVGAEHLRLARACRAGDMLDRADAEHAERARVAAATGRPVRWRAGSDTGPAYADFPFASDGRTVDRIVAVVAAANSNRR